MKPVIGIAAEYNPFHMGHLHHLTQSCMQLGAEAAVVCVMSGSFVQRGEPAIFGKHARAEAAVRSGVDLVLELPLPWALSSAEGFARGCAGLLGALGIVTHMSFGAECDELGALRAVACALSDPAVDAALREEMASGISYAAARQRALARRIGDDVAALVRTPNNILAVEYLKAMDNLGLSMEPLLIRRAGAGHDQPAAPGDVYRSASALRAQLTAGEDLSAFLPPSATAVFQREMERGRGPVTLRALESALLSRLRFLPAGAFHALPDAAEGLGDRLYRAASQAESMDALLAAAATKRYPFARLRRMLLGAALGLRAGMADGVPPYARVLAANTTGTALLRSIGERSSVPVLTKPAAAHALAPAGRALFELTAAAEDFYVLGYADISARAGGADWRQSPFILRERSEQYDGIHKTYL